MKKKLIGIVTLTAVVFVLRASGQAPPPAPAPGTESGFATFQTRCAQCHGNGDTATVDRAPSSNALREMSPEKIYAALTTGPMQQQASALNDGQKKAVAEFMAGRPLGSGASGSSETMGFQCRTNPPLPSGRPAMNSATAFFWPSLSADACCCIGPVVSAA